LSNNLTGSGDTQGALADVVGDAQLLAHSGGLGLPASASELTVLVVTDSAENHGQSLVTSNRIVGAEGLGVIALDVFGVGAEIHVASVPGSALDVVELVVVSIDANLLVSHIAGDDAVDDGSNLGTGDGTLGNEAAILVALEYLQSGQNLNGFFISAVDLVTVREGIGGGHQREAHDHSQDQCENLLQISHGGCFLLLNFLERKALIMDFFVQ